MLLCEERQGTPPPPSPTARTMHAAATFRPEDAAVPRDGLHASRKLFVVAPSSAPAVACSAGLQQRPTTCAHCGAANAQRLCGQGCETLYCRRQCQRDARTTHAPVCCRAL